MSLYRKYRPAQFSDVVGQEAVVKTITEQLKRGEVSHAYLLAGPRGVGKTTIARLLARAVNCVDRKKNQAEPCGTCSSCVAISNGSAFDVIEIDAASHTSVDDVREHIIAGVRVPPQQAKVKVFIIDEAHMLSNAAFNALLKTLEEPPEHVVFVLATTELHKIPATILSRCQRYDFRRVEAAVMKKRLEQIAIAEGREVDSDVFDRVIALSGGCVRDAESVLTKLFALDKKAITSKLADIVLPRSLDNETQRFLSCLSNASTQELFVLTDQLERDGVAPQHFLETFIELLGSTLRAKAEGNLASIFPQNPELALWAEKFTFDSLNTIITRTMQAIEQVKFTPNSFLPIELLGVMSMEAVPRKTSPSIVVDSTVTQSVPQEVPPLSSDTHLQWKTALATIRKQNNGLATFLKFAEPEITEGEVLLTFRYRFYHDRVVVPEHLTLLEQTLSDTFSRSLKVKARLEERVTAPVSSKPEEQPAEGALRFALQAFGGEVVES